jgi:DUF4097 and DUF4098 domain-containing protein YvlB
VERYYRTIERHLETGPQARLDIECRNGNVDVHSHDSPRVRVVALVEVHAETESEAERDFRAVEDGIRVDGNHVRVSAPSQERSTFLFFGRGLKVDYEVLVPYETQVSVEARNGRVEVRSIGGEASVDSRNGSVRVEGVAGRVRVESRNGRIDAADCASDVRLTSRSGNVYVTRARSDVTAETNNGDVVVSESSANAKLRSNNGSLRYAGGVNGNIDLEVEGNGSIRFVVPADSRFALDAEAVRGDVRSDLEVKEHAQSAEPRPAVRLRTVNGSIKIETLEAAR